MAENDLLKQLITLHAQLEALATSAAERSDQPIPAHGAYFMGVMFGTETARDELARLIVDEQRRRGGFFDFFNALTRARVAIPTRPAPRNAVAIASCRVADRV